MTPAIVIAPLSNDSLRDWPLPHFRDLARLCVDRLDARVTFVGSRPQRIPVNEMLRALPPDRFRNLCGRTSWSATAELLAAADCVVANNSGIAHLAAKLGVPTVCVFGASHNPYEWMARGPHVATVTKRTSCSPCALGRAPDCPFDKRCLREIPPGLVFDFVERACRPVAPAAGADPGRVEPRA